jgi:selenium donor protein
LVGFESADDAAVFRIGAADDPDAETIVSTVDFITPIVESPFDFGRIAAANALSDIYAMGGAPLFALNVVGFPTAKLPLEVLAEILAGGAKTTTEAGIPILGGHTTDFDVPVYGMVVTGRAKASGIRRNIGARPGDALVLTKPIGTGILSSALRARALAGSLRRGPEISKEEEATAVETMARLNRSAAQAADPFPVSASTDVTGYGLLGHLREMVTGSHVDAEVDFHAVPLLPGVRRLVEAGIAPGGSHRNLASSRPFVDAPGLRETDLLLLADAQTSGGLLLAVPERHAEALASAIRGAGDGNAAVVGRFRDARGAEHGRILVRP